MTSLMAPIETGESIHEFRRVGNTSNVSLRGGQRQIIQGASPFTLPSLWPGCAGGGLPAYSDPVSLPEEMGEMSH